MAVASQDAIEQLSVLIDQVDEPLRRTFQNIHQGYPTATLVRFHKAREWNVTKAHKMLVDCLIWRIQNHIDDILAKPIIPAELYRRIRDSQLIGLSGYSKEGLPVFAIGVGLSTLDKASVNYYVQSHIQINEYRDRVIFPAATEKSGKHIGTCIKVLDTTGLKLSALNYVKVVKPLLHERTKRKVQVLKGCGRDGLLKNYFSCFFSLPIVLSSMRWGVAAGRKTMVATVMLLLTLSGPIKASTYMLMHGVVGLAMGTLWSLRVNWATSIVLCTLVRALGAVGYVLLSSFLIRENILALITINIHDSLTYIFTAMGVNAILSMNVIYLIFGTLLLLNCAFFVFLLHVLYAIFLSKLGLKDSLTLPAWLENAI